MTSTPEHPVLPELSPDNGLDTRIPAPREVVLDHPDVTWRRPVPDDIDAMHAVIAAADKIDHPSWVTPREDIADLFELTHADLPRDGIVAVDQQGVIVAVGWAFRAPARDVQVNVTLHGAVHPEWTGRGLGRLLLAEIHERARDLLRETRAPLPGAIYLYVPERNRSAARLAEHAGLSMERWFTTMERDLSAPVEVVDPADGVEVVPFEVRWSEQTRLARNDAFRDHWGSVATEPDRWKQLTEGAFLRPDLSWIAVDGDRVIGFSLASVNEEDWKHMGASHTYIDYIGVVRDFRGKRIAPALLTRTLASAKAAGLERAVLDVDSDSPTGANTLYEGIGFAAADRDQVFVERF